MKLNESNQGDLKRVHLVELSNELGCEPEDLAFLENWEGNRVSGDVDIEQIKQFVIGGEKDPFIKAMIKVFVDWRCTYYEFLRRN